MGAIEVREYNSLPKNFEYMVLGNFISGNFLARKFHRNSMQLALLGVLTLWGSIGLGCSNLILRLDYLSINLLYNGITDDEITT